MQRRGQDGGTSTYLVVIGIIIALMVLIPIASCAFKFLNFDSDSLKKFNAMSDLIRSLPADMESDATKSALLHLSDNELVVFFSNNSNGTLFISRAKPDASVKDMWSEPAAETDFMYGGKDTFLDPLLPSVAGGSNSYAIIMKPYGSCGEKACVALCKKFSFSAAEASKVKFFFKTEGLGNADPGSKFYFVTCENPQVNVLESVDKFIMMPTKEWTATSFDDPLPSRETYSNLILGRYDFFFSGAVLSIPYGIFYSEKGSNFASVTLNKPTPGFFGLPDKTRKAHHYIIEKPFATSSSIKDHTPDFYVYFTKLGKDVLICRDPPCLTWQGIKYFQLQKDLLQCINHGDCYGLSYTLSDSALLSKVGNSVTVGVKYQRIYFKYDYGTFTLPYNAVIQIKKSDESSEHVVQGVTLKCAALTQGADPKMYYDIPQEQGQYQFDKGMISVVSWDEIKSKKLTDTAPTLTFNLKKVG